MCILQRLVFIVEKDISLASVYVLCMHTICKYQVECVSTKLECLAFNIQYTLVYDIILYISVYLYIYHIGRATV